MSLLNKPPTPSAMSKFWDAMTASQKTFTCSDCGKTGTSSNVQPQHPYYMEGQEGLALCTDCITDRNRQRAIERKAQLNAMRRCECCNRRATFVSYGVWLCGRHLNNVKRAHDRNAAGAGFLGLFMASSYTPEGIRQMAREQT